MEDEDGKSFLAMSLEYKWQNGLENELLVVVNKGIIHYLTRNIICDASNASLHDHIDDHCNLIETYKWTLKSIRTKVYGSRFTLNASKSFHQRFDFYPHPYWYYCCHVGIYSKDGRKGSFHENCYIIASRDRWRSTLVRDFQCTLVICLNFHRFIHDLHSTQYNSQFFCLAYAKLQLQITREERINRWRSYTRFIIDTKLLLLKNIHIDILPNVNSINHLLII